MRRSRFAVLLSLLLIFALTAAACGPDDSGDDTLTLYSGRSEELVKPLIDRFTDETGIKVEVRYGESPELAATLIAEGGTTDADVFYAQDPASLGSVDDMFSPLPDDILELVDPSYQDRDGLWVGASGRVRVFVYNTDTELDLPRTIDDVINPVWAGQLGVAPTNGSFLAFVSAMILDRGEAATSQWLHDLAALDPVDYPSNAPIVDATDSGEIEGGLVNHYYLLRLRAEGGGASAENWYIPAGDVGTLVMPAGAGVLANSDNPDAAEQFVRFLLSPDSQEYFATVTFEFPLIDGVSPPEGAPHLDEIPSPDIELSELAGVLPLATQLVAEAGLV